MEENKEETNDTAQHDPGVIEVNPVSIAVDEEDAAKPQAKSISASSLPMKRERLWVERDFTMGVGVRFTEAIPDELKHAGVDLAKYAEFIAEMNGHFASGERGYLIS